VDGSGPRAAFDKMTDYFETPPNFVQVMEVMSDWPGKLPGDIGWAYAAIAAEGESEAVTVIVQSESGQHVIRSIEWGRP
jgi:hypothetical protein